MAAEVAEILKKCALKITTSKRKDRVDICESVLVPCIERDDFSEPCVKVAFRLLFAVYSDYRDNRSRKALEKVVKTLADNHDLKAVKHFCAAFVDVENYIKKCYHSPITSGNILILFKWTCIILRSVYTTTEKCQGSEWNKLVECHYLATYGALSAGNTIVCKVVNKKLLAIWKEVPGITEKYAKAISELQPSEFSLCLVGELFTYCSKNKVDQGIIAKYKKSLIDVYIKNILSVKTKQSTPVLCSRFLCHLTREDFSDLILPAVLKALLRNPETVLECTGYLIAALSIDLSKYAVNICKNVSGQLRAKEDIHRQQAAFVIKGVADHCSDPNELAELIKYLFAVLGGSEGKLTVWNDRAAILEAIGCLEANSIGSSSSMENLVNIVVEKIIPYLQQEVQETAVVKALSILALWCKHIVTEVPKLLIEAFKKGMNNKVSTAVVQSGYIQCMGAALKGNTLLQGMEVLPQLLQSVERASSQPHQTATVTAGLMASSILVRLSLADIKAESKLGSFWTTFLDAKKMLFVSDKFLQAASPEALQALLSTMETLFISHSQRLNKSNRQPWYHAIVCLMTNQSQKLRQDVHTFLHKLYVTAGTEALDHQSLLLEEFSSLLAEQQLTSKISSSSGLTNGTTEAPITNGSEASTSTSIPNKILVKTLIMLALAPFKSDTSLDEQLRENIALSVLPYCHYALIVSYKKDLWIHILSDLKLDVSSVVEKYEQEIMNKIVDQPNQEVSQNIVSTIAAASPLTLPSIVTHLITCLSDNKYTQVTVEEVEIMESPADEICNKKVLESLKASEQSKTKNVKKESRAYSYEDQKWSMEYEEEQKRKKKAAGLLSFRDELSDKDKETYDNQLKIEAEIRIKTQQTKQELTNLVALLLKATESNQAAMKKFIPTILPVLLSLLNSPLASSSVVPVVLALRKCVFDEDNNQLGTLVSHVTLRLLQPKCHLNPSWCQENLQSAASRAVKALHQLTSPTSQEDPDTRPLSAPGFTYCFPMLNCILRAGGKAISCDEDLRATALQVISRHCQLRSIEENEEDDESGPELLPRKAMFTLFNEIISTSSDSIKGSHLQQLASFCLLELCKSASGEDGCTVAEPEELEVVLKGLESPASVLRFSVLKGLLEMSMVLPGIEEETELSVNVLRRLWVAKFDPDEENAALGQKLWDESHYTVLESLCSDLIQDIVHDVGVIRQAASSALTEAVSQHSSVATSVLHKLIKLYDEKTKIPAPVVNELGRVISEPFIDPWPARSGIAQALGKLSPCLDEDQIPPLFAFFVPTGLGDRNEDVRKEILNAALQAVNDHGKDNISNLLPVFEEFLDLADDTRAHDLIRQSVIILMGSLAKHLDKEDPKVKPIVNKLIKALSTPSQQVQQAVANCLPPLVPAIKAEAPELVKMLLNQLLESTVYGERKGAAYGLAGLVKGLGILYLKQLNIMTTLQEAIQNKKNYRHREGALFAFEMLCTMLGRLFEPYVVHVLPHLLLCFGDGNQYVREATDDTARAVMKHLSAHGVKLVLPSLLSALNEDSWRTKSGSVELLGAMAYCAPKQLSSCLPSIVPMLCKVLTDSHQKVQKSGAQALRQIGAVIRNPEIQAISSVLLEALMDPSTKTAPCLQVLLQTSFVHFIDAPSLALIMPVLQRALNERSTETKKMAAQIIGNMYSLTDPKDLLPYLSSVVPGLKQSLLDPVPEVRAVSARALGALVKGMGEEHFEDLLPWLMETLTSENSSVDRSGAAQGISEVLYGLGKIRLDKLMPDVISTTEKTELAPHVREGYLMLYIYLPGTFREEFTEYIGPILSSIIQGLADEVEFVRDTSLRAGQRIVNMYAETAIELFLPEMERGLFDDNWRIRHSSIQLLGDLLYKISGVTGKMSTEGDEDDNFGTSHSNQKIIDALGVDRRNRVLAGLYMGRSDVSLMVRQAALHVWKVIVPNTPRVLREILSTLFSLLLGCLASKSFDKTQVAARTLGDLVRKLGERVLPEIIPILEEGLNSEKSNERQGVCVGLSEIISSTSKEQVFQYVDSLVPTVRRTLCDPLPEVRRAAAKTFDNLYSTIGAKALDEILTDLLDKMDDPSLSEYALDGLRQVMQVNSRVVLPFLVPKLIAPPVNARALAILSSVAGESLVKHLTKILPALLYSIQESMATGSEQEELDGAEKLVLSVESDDGVRTIIEELLEAAKNKNPGLRKAAVILLFKFCSKTKADYSQFITTLFRNAIQLLNDEDVDVVVNSWETLKAIIESLQPTEQLQYIAPLLQSIRFVRDEVKGGELPGFCLPGKGIKCILPVFREGILTGTPELKEQAANGLGEVIKLTSAAALKPSVVNITGPLIRILGDRFSWNVKVAVLETLGLLLGKVGVMLKPFLPQLQTTFVKALNDPNKIVRVKAACALHRLVILHTRVDPLFTELQNCVKNNEDNAIKETLLQALKGVISGAGQKMSDTVRNTLTSTLLSLLGHGENIIRVAAGICIGSLATILPDNELGSLISDQLTVNDPSVDWFLRHGHAIALSAVLHDAPAKVLACGLYDVITDAAVTHASSDRIPIGSFGVRSLGFLLSHSKKQAQKPAAQVVKTLTQTIQTGSTEVRSLSSSVVKNASKSSDEPLDTTILKSLVPALIASAKDKNTSVRASAEAALAEVLKLSYGDDTLQTCSRFLDSNSADLLNDMCRRTLRRLANQEDFGVDEVTSPYNLDMG